MRDAKFEKMFWGIVIITITGIIVGYALYAWIAYKAYSIYKENNSSEIAKTAGALYKEFRRAAEKEE